MDGFGRTFYEVFKMAIMPFLAIREYFMAHVISIHARILFSRHKNLIFGMLPDGGVYEDIIDYS